MILVDTSVWVDHLRRGDAKLAQLLDAGQVLAHPFVTGELALGALRQREAILSALVDLPHATVATDDDVLAFVTSNALYGVGVSWVDVHLLAAVRLTSDASLWTRDKWLLKAAGRMNLNADLP